MSNLKKITNVNFPEFINSEKLVMVDFFADWCGPCKVLLPIMDKLSEEYSEQIIIGKMNVDEDQSIASEYGIRNIPTVLFFKNNELIDRFSGNIGESAIRDKINKYR